MTEQAPGTPGTLYAIGVGPGDPELLTLKAVRLLGRVDLVFVPRQPGRRSLAREIAAPHLDPARQQIVELDHRMSGRPAGNRACWQANAATIARHLAAGRDGAFLTEGDPLLHSTFLHIWSELDASRSGVPVSIVPGISSVFAGAAVAGLPLGTGQDRVAIVPALQAPEDLHDLLHRFATVILLKSGRTIADLSGLARALGDTHDFVFVEQATRAGQTIIRDPDALAGRGNDYFSLAIFRRKAESA